MDVVLVGLPGSGKSVVGKRLAHRHAATFIDLDDTIVRDDGRTIPEIFAEDGEAAFRRLEQAAVESWMRPRVDQGFSLCDAVSFEVMQRERVKRALTFDRHFAAAGFEILS